MLRIVAGFSIEEPEDFLFFGVAAWAALVKLEDYYDQVFPDEDLLRIRPTAIVYCMRLLLYKDPATESLEHEKAIARKLKKWRDAHKPFVRRMKDFLKDEELSSIITYLTTNIDRLSFFIPFL